MPLFCSYHILTSSVIYYWTDARQHGIYLLNRQRCSRHARVNLSRNVIANQERSFWEINLSYCEKVIDNPCTFFVSWIWSPPEINTFFGVMVKTKSLSVLLWATIFVITVGNIVEDSRGAKHFDHCDDEYLCRPEYRQRWTTFDLLNFQDLKFPIFVWLRRSFKKYMHKMFARNLSTRLTFPVPSLLSFVFLASFPLF